MSRDQKPILKLCHVFEKPAIIRTAEGNSKGNLYNQLKNFKGIFVDPYIVLADFDTKLVHVLDKGDRKSIFPPFDGELCYIKANPAKGSPVALVGYDFQDQLSSKALKVKYYSYISLSKDNPEKRITNLTRKGKEIMYDLFHINDNYTALAMATTKGSAEIRIVCSKNLALIDPTREVELSFESQTLKHIFLPVCDAVDVQNLYYTTQTGIYYMGMHYCYIRCY